MRAPQRVTLVDNEVLPRFSNVVYRIQSGVEQAPLVADCLTSAVYFFRHAYQTALPLYYIGDMPRILVKRHAWRALRIPIDQVDEGDLVFLKSRKMRRLVGHVAWVSDGRFHHVNQKGLHSVPFCELLQHYHQPWKGEKLLRYIDRRNIFCRSVNRGIYTLDKERISYLS